MKPRILQLLQELRLHGMEEHWENILIQAEQSGTAVADVLLDLLETEYRAQHARCLNNRIKRAHIPEAWTIDIQPDIIKRSF